MLDLIEIFLKAAIKTAIWLTVIIFILWVILE